MGPTVISAETGCIGIKRLWLEGATAAAATATADGLVGLVPARIASVAATSETIASSSPSTATTTVFIPVVLSSSATSSATSSAAVASAAASSSAATHVVRISKKSKVKVNSSIYYLFMVRR
jgi:hypothetical protein